ncbi:MAG: MarC family protein, partial [Burkholderiales bacterium]|nr:MarC family protein [Burkholderiales bacterium]
MPTRKLTPRVATAILFGVLAAFTPPGKPMLVFGIRLPSFFVVGDLLLLLLSLSMVQAHISPKRKTPEKDKVERPIG